jgi:Tfp pilus assembly protein PilZ
VSYARPPTRRRFRRMTVRILVDYVVDGVPRCEYATTLGAGGLFIESEDPALAGTLLKVRFRLSARGPLHEIESRVVWCRPPTEAGASAPGMGLDFLDALASARLAHELESMGGGSRL